MATFAILFATALIDVVLYLIVPDALMCYRCGAMYRQAEGGRSRTLQPGNARTLSPTSRPHGGPIPLTLRPRAALIDPGGQLPPAHERPLLPWIPNGNEFKPICADSSKATFVATTSFCSSTRPTPASTKSGRWPWSARAHWPTSWPCVEYAAENQLPIHPRGAGTGLAGESLGRGIVLDFSRYMRRVLETGEDRVRIQPGIVHAQLNEFLRP